MKNFPLILHETAITWRNLLDVRLKPLGLSQAKWRALIYLSFADKPLTQTELAKKLGIEGASVVGLIDRLNKEGWVERQVEAHDRRIRTLVLTKKASTAINKIQAIADELCEELLRNINKQSLKNCVSVLESIKSRIVATKE